LDQSRAAPSLLPGIQLLRGLAATGVVLHHALEESSAGRVGPRSPEWLTMSGAAGVDIFFVISGFIMLYVAFGETRPVMRPLTFLLRRAQRIYPLYWLCCAAFITIGAAGFLQSQNFSPGVIIRSVLLLPSAPMMILVAWTLVFEMIFYVIFASTLAFRSRRVSITATTIAILGLTVFSEWLPDDATRQTLSNPIALEFCFGLMLALWFSRSRHRGALGLPAAALAIIIIAAAPFFVGHDSTAGLAGMPRILVWGGAATVIVAAFLHVTPRPGWPMRLSMLFGDASYAIYLTHAFVMIVYAKLLKVTALGDLPQPAIVAAVVLLAVLIGIAVHLLVERPLQAWVRHSFSGAAKPAGTAPIRNAATAGPGGSDR
jgi:peptidoglycan/LPS O-acetylase OafA/YrhL